MRKQLQTWLRRAGLSLALVATAGGLSLPAQAQTLLLDENFNYDVGDLYQQGGWIKYGSNAAAPIQVSATSLTYAGYQADAVGGSAVMTGVSSAQDLFTKFPSMVAEGTIYASFLINVSEVPSDAVNWYAFIPESKKGMNDGSSGTELCKLFMKPGADNSHFRLSISRNAGEAKSIDAGGEYEVGKTYLIVAAYTFVEGGGNDEVSLWVNPDTSLASAPTPTAQNDVDAELVNNEANINYGGFLAIELRQGGKSGVTAATMTIDAIRVATNWADLFPASSTPPVTAPSLTIEPTEFIQENLFPEMQLPFMITITGTNLTSDVTVTYPEGVTGDVTTIPAADIMGSQYGYDLMATLNAPATAGAFSRELIFSSEGMDDVVFPISGSVADIPVAENATAVRNLLTTDYADIAYRYTGNAVVTYVTKTELAYGSEYNIYAQDATGGMRINSAYLYGPVNMTAGEEFTNVFFYLEEELGAPKMMAVSSSVDGAFYKRVSTGNTTTPTEITIPEMTTATLPAAIYKLCKLSNVHFSNTEGTFEAGKNYEITDGTNTANIRIFAGSELVGTAIPTGNLNLTGISTSTGALVLSLRYPSDIEEAAEPTPTISIDPTEFTYEGMLPEMQLPVVIYIVGKDLKGDITITCPEGVTCDKTTVPAAEAMTEYGAPVTITITAPATAGAFSRELIISSEGAEDVTFPISGVVENVSSVPNASAVLSLLDTEYADVLYRYTGKAVVTYVEQNQFGYGTEYNIYAQDMTGGIMVNSAYLYGPVNLNVGDEFSNLFFYLEGVLGAPKMYAVSSSADGSFCKVTATGKTKTPADITIADMTSATLPYAIYKLCKLSNVRFSNTEGTFEAGKNYEITDGTNTANIRVFAGSELVGTAIPAGSVNLTGISTSAGALVLSLRYLSDIEAGAPSAVITAGPKFDFTNNAAPINVDTEVASYTVVAENLPVAVPIMASGMDANMFRTEPAEIPAGSSTTTVKVYYHPTAIGTHKGGILINFDAVNPALNYSDQFGSCKAYDPDNMPAITIEPAVIELETKPGVPVTATATLTATGAFDFITAARATTGDNGGITINNTYLPANSEGVTLTVTFNPTAEGEFTETWTYTTTLCATPATLTVKAKCAEEAPEEPREGDTAIKADFANPYSWYTQDFAEVEANKPLAIAEWSNIAVEGTRAWWGSTGTNDDEFKAAKVTAYDSAIKPGEGKSISMRLVSPALDFKNAPEKKLKFRIMGMFLNENSGDKLTIQLGEQVSGDDGSTAVEFYDLAGFDIPAIPDEAGKWVAYDVDMSAVEDMPDTFVIGFLFSGTRGTDNTTTYYLTDFEWGAKAQSLDVIGSEALTPDADGYYNVYNLQGIRVLRTLDAAELRNLAPGMYICSGSKFIKK